MNKIKSTELFEELTKASQKAYTAEDSHFRAKVADIIFSDDPAQLKYIQIAMMVSEYNRFSIIKTIIKILQKYDIIENDLDINDKKLCDEIVLRTLDK